MAADHQGGGGALRDYRKGNWTLQETMILIEAKKMDDERRMKKLSGEVTITASNKPTELRWKWVEDYCWRKACFRSQNQCNDKWDNLMRDYKRVRDYEKTRLLLLSSKNDNDNNNINNNNNNKNEEEEEEEEGCYWKIEKSERKGKNLPSNMLQQIYEALVEVVERKGSSSSSSSQQQHQQQHQHQQQQQQQQRMGYHVNVVELIPPPVINVAAQPINQIAPAPILQALPPPPPAAMMMSEPPPVVRHPLPGTTTGDRSSGEETSGGGGTGSPAAAPVAKRRRKEDGSSSSSSSTTKEAIRKGAKMIARAIEAGEERGETRHREVLSLQERRVGIEESNTQRIQALVHAINNLATSILALASSNNNNTPPPK